MQISKGFSAPTTLTIFLAFTCTFLLSTYVKSVNATPSGPVQASGLDDLIAMDPALFLTPKSHKNDNNIHGKTVHRRGLLDLIPLPKSPPSGDPSSPPPSPAPDAAAPPPPTTNGGAPASALPATPGPASTTDTSASPASSPVTPAADSNTGGLIGTVGQILNPGNNGGSNTNSPIKVNVGGPNPSITTLNHNPKATPIMNADGTMTDPNEDGDNNVNTWPTSTMDDNKTSTSTAAASTTQGEGGIPPALIILLILIILAVLFGVFYSCYKVRQTKKRQNQEILKQNSASLGYMEEGGYGMYVGHDRNELWRKNMAMFYPDH